jgi:hypothetical protein
MVTAFFFGTGECFLNILPRSRSVETKYFAEEIVGGLEDAYYLEERNPQEVKMPLHFDNAPIHSIRTVMGQLEQSGLKKYGIRPAIRISPRVTSFFLVT